MKPNDLLTAEPGDPRFAVWGDELTEQGDPRGALVSLCRQLEQRPDDAQLQGALAELIAANEEAWCPNCLEEETLRLTWRDGFIDTVTFDGAPMEGAVGYDQEEEEPDEHYGAGTSLHRLITLPTAARISGLSLRCPLDAEGNHGCWGHHEAFVARMLTRAWPRLRALDFDGATLPQLKSRFFHGYFHSDGYAEHRG